MTTKTYNALSQAMRLYQQGLLDSSGYYHAVCKILLGG
jgi:hypothetical protein